MTMMAEELESAHAFKNILLASGVIKTDAEGLLSTVDDPAERESLKKEIASKSKQKSTLLGAPDGD